MTSTIFGIPFLGDFTEPFPTPSPDESFLDYNARVKAWEERKRAAEQEEAEEVPGAPPQFPGAQQQDRNNDLHKRFDCGPGLEFLGSVLVPTRVSGMTE